MAQCQNIKFLPQIIIILGINMKTGKIEKYLLFINYYFKMYKACRKFNNL